MDPSIAHPELVVQDYHKKGIECVAFSPDSRWILTGSEDKTAILFDAVTGRKLRTFSHATRVISVTFISDGKTAITVNNDGNAPEGSTVHVWETATGRELRQYHLIGWYCSFSSDGWRLFSMASMHREKKEVQLLDLKSGRGKILHLDRVGGAVYSFALSPNGQQVLFGKEDGEVSLLDTTSWKEIRRFHGHNGTVYAVAFSPNGRQVLTGSKDKTARLWDVATGRELQRFECWPCYTNSYVGFSPDGRQVAVTHNVDNKTTVRVWDIAKRVVSQSFPGTFGEFSPSGRYFVSSYGALWVYVGDVNTGEQTYKSDQSVDPVECAAISTDGRYLGISGGSDFVEIWDLAVGKPVHVFEGLSKGRRFNSLAFSPDGSFMLTGGGDKNTSLWELRSGKRLHCFDAQRSVASVAFAPAGQQLVTGGGDNTARVWDTMTRKELRRLDHRGTVHAVAYSPDGRRVLTGAEWSYAQLWDITTGKRIWRHKTGHAVHAVAFSPDSSKVLLGDYSGKVSIHDAISGNYIRSLSGHKKLITCTVFSHDSRRILTGSKDNTSRLWDTATGTCLQVFEGHTSSVVGAFFHPTSQVVFTASNDGTVRVWDSSTGKELVRIYHSDRTRIKEWLVVSPEGFFDGSPDGLKAVAFRIGDSLNVIPVERFFQDFYRPGLLTAIMRGERPLPSVDIGKQLPPEVRIVSQTQSAVTEEDATTIEAVIEDKGGGIKTPWIKQNGSRVIVDSKPVREGNRLQWKFELPLVDGENKIEVQSASADGSWESEPARVTLTRTTPTEKTELYLLAIGVSKYTDESVNLNYAAADAQAFAKLFRTRGADSYGEGRVHIQTLLDKDATSENIEQAIAKIAEKAQPQDVFMLTLSGHGIMVGQRYFFLPHEFTSKDEGGWKEDAKKYGLPGDELQTWINRIPALKRVVVYDTCQSGGAIAVASLSRDAFGFQRAFETFRRSTGCYIIAAATASQNAEEIDDIGHGALTYALLAGLGAVDRGPFQKRTAESKDGLIQVDDWLGFARDNVPTLTKTYYGQEQLVNVFGEGRSFPILRVKGNKP